MQQLLMMNHVVGGDATNCEVFIMALLVEIMLLGWPVSWLKKSIGSVPGRHQSSVIRICRFIKSRIVDNSDRDLAENDGASH